MLPAPTEELEYHDLLSLFEFLDNGDGEITFLAANRSQAGSSAIFSKSLWLVVFRPFLVQVALGRCNVHKTSHVIKYT